MLSVCGKAETSLYQPVFREETESYFLSSIQLDTFTTSWREAGSTMLVSAKYILCSAVLHMSF